MTVLVVGSVALDSVETPFGKAENVIGGSATFFAASASLLTKVQVVGIVGSDYPIEKLERLLSARRRSRGARARRRRVLPLARSLSPRPQLGRDARDEARRLLSFRAEDPRAVPRHAVRLPRQHRPAPAARGPAPGAQAEARGLRHDELLDREPPRRPARAAQATSTWSRSTTARRGSSPRRRISCRAAQLDHGARAEARDHQEGRARRVHVQRPERVLRAGVSARERVRSHRRRRLVRRRLHRLPRAHGRPQRGLHAPGGGVRMRDGLLRRRALLRGPLARDHGDGSSTARVEEFRQLVAFEKEIVG